MQALHVLRVDRDPKHWPHSECDRVVAAYNHKWGRQRSCTQWIERCSTKEWGDYHDVLM